MLTWWTIEIMEKNLEDRFWYSQRMGDHACRFPMSKTSQPSEECNITDGEKEAYVFPGLQRMHADLPAA